MSHNHQFTNEDEALARALQEEYEQEYRRRSLQQHLRQTPSARSHSSRPPPTAPPAAEVFNSTTSTAFNPFGFDEEQERRDEEYARQLELELQAQEAANSRRASMARTSSARNGSRSSQRVVRGTSVPARGNSSQNMARSNSYWQSGDVALAGSRVLSDEEIARQLEQEEQDAALAMSINANEQTQYDGEVAARAAQPQRSCLRRLGSCLVTLAMLAVATGLLVYYFGGSDALPDFIPDPELFREEDPFSDTNPEDTNRWRNDGSGLELTMINALDEIWYDYFYQAVSDWDNGEPDTLDLKTKLNTAGPESVCRAMTGYIKVCNGNYGQTNWRGINKVLLENGWIYASSARMNEFYFSGTDEAQRQYTMCHEIGHGFGLPHTDENFYNKDLGNCMDYTNKPENNMRPSKMNFDFLGQMYGSFDGSVVPGSLGDIVETTVAVPNDQPEQEEDPDSKKGKDKGKGPDDRRLRKLREEGSPELRDLKLELAEEVDLLIKNGTYGQHHEGWRLLHGNDHVESYEVDLGDGYSVQYHMLLVPMKA